MKTCFIYKATLCEEVLYIGIADKLPRRLSQHKSSSQWYDLQDKIEFAELPNRSICKLYETYLIKTLTPKFNKAENNGDNFSLVSFDESNIKWETYVKPTPKGKEAVVEEEDVSYLEGSRDFVSIIKDNKRFLTTIGVGCDYQDEVKLGFEFPDNNTTERFKGLTGLNFRTDSYNLVSSMRSNLEDSWVEFKILIDGFDEEDVQEKLLVKELKQVLGI